MKKTNPRNRPASQVDVERARIDGVRSGLELAIYAAVKRMEAQNVEKQAIEQLAEDVMSVCENITKGYIKFADVEKTLREEYKIEVVLK